MTTRRLILLKPLDDSKNTRNISNPDKDTEKDTDKEDTDKEDTDKEDTDKEDTDKEDTDKEDTYKQNTDKEDTDKEDTDKEDTDKQNTDKQNTDKQNTDKQNTDKQNTDKQNTDKDKGTTRDTKIDIASKSTIIPVVFHNTSKYKASVFDWLLCILWLRLFDTSGKHGIEHARYLFRMKFLKEQEKIMKNYTKKQLQIYKSIDQKFYVFLCTVAEQVAPVVQNFYTVAWKAIVKKSQTCPLSITEDLQKLDSILEYIPTEEYKWTTSGPNWLDLKQIVITPAQLQAWKPTIEEVNNLYYNMKKKLESYVITLQNIQSKCHTLQYMYRTQFQKASVLVKAPKRCSLSGDRPLQ